MREPVVAALFGRSSKVKLTIGASLRNWVGSTRKCVASRWLTLALASDHIAFIIQRFRKIM
jgi:hypothetical protein